MPQVIAVIGALPQLTICAQLTACAGHQTHLQTIKVLSQSCADWLQRAFVVQSISTEFTDTQHLTRSACFNSGRQTGGTPRSRASTPVGEAPQIRADLLGTRDLEAPRLTSALAMTTQGRCHHCPCRHDTKQESGRHD